MSIELIPRAELSQARVSELEKKLAEFYARPPREYYEISDRSAGHYSAEELPFHHDLVEHVSKGMSVLELGCGTAHLCPYVEARGGRYTGVDHSEELLARNRQRFPRADFRRVGQAPDGQFDMVVSLYAIEHVVDPPAYLEDMWQKCRPGGWIGIICPEFLESPGLPPSVFYGRTPRRLREKLKSLSFLDAAAHVMDLRIGAKRWKERLRASPPGTFWINPRTAVLEGGAYSIDADAVHAAGLRDLVWFFRGKGVQSMRTSSEMIGLKEDLARYNCYVLARKT